MDLVLLGMDIWLNRADYLYVHNNVFSCISGRLMKLVFYSHRLLPTYDTSLQGVLVQYCT